MGTLLHPNFVNNKHLRRLSPEDLLVLQNNDATLDELKDLLYAQTNVSIGRSTLDRMLTKLEITRKKALHPTEKGSERVQTLRFEYWQLIQSVLLKDLVFLDESGIHLGMTRSHARSRKGERARGDVPPRGKNVSLIGAVGINGLLGQIALLGSVNGLTFEAFIVRRLVPKLWPEACAAMDNCSIHKGAEIERLINEAGARLICLPPLFTGLFTY
jgi:hypothetical protein